MSSIAIIPARGGSKRIPRKNIRPFHGRPIIAHVIGAALESQLFEEVMVSTEDEEISEIALGLGATVPFRRSDQTADDYAGTVDVLLEVIREYEVRNRRFHWGCCIYPTAPFVRPDLLARGRQLMMEAGYESVFPVIRYPYPIQRALRFENGRVKMLWPEHYDARSQDLLPAFHDAGQFYWFQVEALKKKKRLWMETSGAIVIPESQAQDIDTFEDWHLAEIKFSRWQQECIR
jgi:pseudaminic acid cytidylyltransferase